VLSGYTTIESKSIPNHHQCDFGKWYDNAPATVKNHPLFKEVGRGWKILAMMVDGDKTTGWIAGDNLLSQRPLLGIVFSSFR